MSWREKVRQSIRHHAAGDCTVDVLPQAGEVAKHDVDHTSCDILPQHVQGRQWVTLAEKDEAEPGPDAPAVAFSHAATWLHSLALIAPRGEFSMYLLNTRGGSRHQTSRVFREPQTSRRLKRFCELPGSL